jgi:hypothetical protein
LASSALRLRLFLTVVTTSSGSPGATTGAGLEGTQKPPAFFDNFLFKICSCLERVHPVKSLRSSVRFASSVLPRTLLKQASFLRIYKRRGVVSVSIVVGTFVALLSNQGVSKGLLKSFG